MNYRVYNYELDKSDINLNEGANLSNLQKAKVEQFFRITTRIILNVQGDIGINKIGNIMRYDQELKSFFDSENENLCLIKGFENRRYTLNLLFKCFLSSKKENLIFVFNEDFRKKSKIVDSTSTTTKDIDREIRQIGKIFSTKSIINFSVIEILSFPKYTFTDSLEGKYSIMSKLN